MGRVERPTLTWEVLRPWHIIAGVPALLGYLFGNALAEKGWPAIPGICSSRSPCMSC